MPYREGGFQGGRCRPGEQRVAGCSSGWALRALGRCGQDFGPRTAGDNSSGCGAGGLVRLLCRTGRSDFRPGQGRGGWLTKGALGGLVYPTALYGTACRIGPALPAWAKRRAPPRAGLTAVPAALSTPAASGSAGAARWAALYGKTLVHHGAARIRRTLAIGIVVRTSSASRSRSASSAWSAGVVVPGSARGLCVARNSRLMSSALSWM